MSMDISMESKVCIVTGANSGIGWVTARELCRRQAMVTLVCRNERKGEEACDAIEKAGGRRPKLLLGDLSNLDEVRRVAQSFIDQNDRLDLLVNNAGAYFPRRQESAQGLEMTFALNHMAYFLLTDKLAPLWENTPASRIINVASRAHRMGELDFDDLQWATRPYRAFKVYGTSKLLNILFTRELARRIAQLDTVTHCLHPGVVRTGFGKDEPGVFKMLARLLGPFLISAQEGAKTSVYLSTDPDVQMKNGLYFSRCRPVEPEAKAQDDAAAARLWSLSEAIARKL
jgi:retinol dehydrogenase 12